MPTQTQIDYAKRIADKYIGRDGGRPVAKPTLCGNSASLIIVDEIADILQNWNCRCAMPRTMEEITAILEKTP